MLFIGKPRERSIMISNLVHARYKSFISHATQHDFHVFILNKNRCRLADSNGGISLEATSSGQASACLRAFCSTESGY